MEYCHFRCTLQLPKKTAHIWRATTGFPKKQLVIAWDRLWNRETWQVWNQWWRRKIFSGHILKLDPFKNMQFLHIDHLFSHSLCAIIPSLVSKAALKEAFYNNNGEANTHSADFSTLNDVNFFVFLLPLHCLFTREVILYHVTVLILCSLTWVVVVWWNLHVQFWSKCLGHFVFRCGRCNSNIDPPPPLDSVGCYKSNTFYISCTCWGPQLCSEGKSLFKALFMSVYHGLAANSILKKSEKLEVSQNRLARIVDSSF